MLKLILVLSVQYRFSYLMQRIFRYNGIQNIILTADKDLNTLINRTPFYTVSQKNIPDVF